MTIVRWLRQSVLLLHAIAPNTISSFSNLLISLLLKLSGTAHIIGAIIDSLFSQHCYYGSVINDGASLEFGRLLVFLPYFCELSRCSSISKILNLPNIGLGRMLQVRKHTLFTHDGTAPFITSVV